MTLPISPEIANHILQRLGETGQPPESGVMQINVGNESYLQILEHEYFRRQLLRGASFKLVQGYFGGGKTHFLYCVRELAWAHNFAVSLVELSPTECPYDDSLKVYQAVARRISIRGENEMQAANYGISDLIRNVIDDRIDIASKNSTIERAQKETKRWLQRIVGRASCESHSYRQAIVSFGMAYLVEDYSAEQVLGAWLAGEPVPTKDIKSLGVYESMTRNTGFLMLRALVQMIHALGFGGTALLFDEVDRNLSVSAKRSQAIGDNLRQVIDLCGRHQLPRTLFMYAVPPEFLRNVVPEYPALEQRIKAPIPLSVRSPQAVLIDLERLDVSPADMLSAIGKKLVDVFAIGRGDVLNTETQNENAKTLAQACVATHFEVNHRRLFVKTFVDLLHRQMVDGDLLLTESNAKAIVSIGYETLSQPNDDDDFEDY